MGVLMRATLGPTFSHTPLSNSALALLSRAIADRDQLLHHFEQAAFESLRPKRIMQRAIELVQFLIDGVRFCVRLECAPSQTGHRALGIDEMIVAAGFCSSDD